jgi:type IV secretory pathway VirB2 component (pilin)
MKKIILSILLLSFMAIGSSRCLAAVDIKTCPTGTSSDVSSSTLCSDNTAANKNPIISGLKVVLDVMSYIAGIIAVISLIIAGFKLVLGGGNSDQYNSARGMIIFVIVGVAVVVLSQTIVVFILDKL